MKKIILFLLFVIYVSAQVENVPLDHGVYTFLKEMEVKKVIYGINEDIPNLKYGTVKKFLKQIESKKNQLSKTEIKLFEKYRIEFYDEEINNDNTWNLFGSSPNIFTSPFSLFDDRQKYLYNFKDGNNNVFVEMLGTFNYGHRVKPSTNNAELYDIGFRFRGTLFSKLGYNLTVIKGGVSGNKDFSAILDPRMNYNFKFIEDIENIINYDFVEGYLQYNAQPTEGIDITVQLGREKITLGYGYNSKLSFSGDHPMMDFFKFNLKYGVVNFTSIHASTVGDFSFDRSQLYTKYIAMNRIKLSFPDFMDFGVGEMIVYSDRGIDLAYFNPLLFYKFAEMSLQDRDNGLFFIDAKTNFWRNLEFHGTFFLDENLLGHLQHLSRYSNKTAYQLGAMWYQPLGLCDLSLFVEYTKIRPYTYSHTNNKNTFTAFDQILGHRIGPNADEIFIKAAYNLNEWIRPSISYAYIRAGNNIVSENGTLIKNVGGDVFQPYRYDVDPIDAPFLDGNRVNTTEIIANLKIEPFRDIIFDISYNYIFSDHVTEKFSNNLSYAQLVMKLQF